MQTVYVPGASLSLLYHIPVAGNTCRRWLPTGGLFKTENPSPGFTAIRGPKANTSLSEFKAPAPSLTLSGGAHDRKSPDSIQISVTCSLRKTKTWSLYPSFLLHNILQKNDQNLMLTTGKNILHSRLGR